jgi:hypothetical protein
MAKELACQKILGKSAAIERDKWTFPYLTGTVDPLRKVFLAYALMKLLLVEDNERVAYFIKKGLIEAGHTIDHADNGRDGMFLGAGEPYDVVVMDRMLPGAIARPPCSACWREICPLLPAIRA